MKNISRSKSSVPKSFIVAGFIVAALGIFADVAHAYIGPGAGIALATSLLTLLSAFALVLLGILVLPFRLLRRFIKNRGRQKIPKEILRHGKAVIIGLDGMDPRTLERLMSKGQLPNISRIIEQGGYRRLRTTTPADSQVAWASFLTGCNPGQHNVFDSVARDPKNYHPISATAETRPAKWRIRIGSLKIPVGSSRIIGLRKGMPFWSYLAGRGVNTVIQWVPGTYPSERFDGILICAMDVPGPMGSRSASTLFTTDNESGGKLDGGRIVHLSRIGDQVETSIPGTNVPFAANLSVGSVPVEIVVVDHSRIRIKLNGRSIILAQGEYSEWIDLDFPSKFGRSVSGIARFLVKSVAPELEIFMTPINIDPEKSALPIAHPQFYSKYLFLCTGKFGTSGVAIDTSAFDANALSPDEFLRQCQDIFEERQRIFNLELGKLKRGLLVHVFDLADRVQHIFWQYSDPQHPRYDEAQAKIYGGVIDDIYRQMDEFIGDVYETISKDDLFVLMSNHGFSSFRWAFNLNTWLRHEGYLCLKDGMQTSPGYFENVDWTRTQAYAAGLNGIYLNIQGRESRGIIEEKNAHPIKRELKNKLESYVDPHSGHRVIHSVKIATDIYNGAYAHHAPDLLVGYAENYRASWDTISGSVPPRIVEENNRNWSGDHSIAPELVPGILVCNKVINAGNPSIMDIAPSVLNHFKFEPPAHMDGNSFLDG